MSKPLESNRENDAKYKKYSLSIEKSLQSFESIDEWADIISFLTKFCKILQSFPAYHTVPKKILVSKRLAQCLNPALPSGVHQKALETYMIIFEKLGTEKLCHDFYVYSYGLLPFFRHSSLSVKSTLFLLLEKHILPHIKQLEPALKSILMSLLPGLEEETNDHFSAIFKYICSIKDSIGESLFLYTIWDCMLNAPSLRLSILNYLSKSDDLGAQYLQHIFSSSNQHRSMLISALAASTLHPSSLVIRSVLELILKIFPLSQADTSMSLLSEDEQILITRSILIVLLKRDLSLTRRCIAWMTSNNDSINPFLFDLLYKTIKRMLFDSLDVIPFKVLVAILDKPEIGLPLCKISMMDIITALYNHQDNHNLPELIQTANTFFQVADLYIVWSTLYYQLDNISDNVDAQSHLIKMLLFSMKWLSISDNEAEHIHLPCFLFLVLYFAHNRCMNANLDKLFLIDHSIQLCIIITEKIPISYLKYSSIQTNVDQLEIDDHIDDPDDIKSILNEYYHDNGQPPDSSQLPLPKRLFHGMMILIYHILHDAFHIILASQSNPSAFNTDIVLKIVKGFSKLIIRMISGYSIMFGPILSPERADVFLDSLQESLAILPRLNDLRTKIVIVQVALKICSNSFFKPVLFGTLKESLPSIYQHLWPDSSKDTNDTMFQTVSELFWSLYETFPSDDMDKFFVLLLSSNERDIEKQVYNASRFSKFWTISSSIPHVRYIALQKSLFIMLDYLSMPMSNPVRHVAMYWFVQASSSDHNRLIDPLLLVLADHTISYETNEMSIFQDTFPIRYYSGPFNDEQVLYALQRLLVLVRQYTNRSSPIFEWMKRAPVVLDAFMSSYVEKATMQYITYAELFFDLVSKFVLIECQDIKDQRSNTIIASIQITALELMHFVLEKDLSFFSSDRLDAFMDGILFKLYHSVSHHQMMTIDIDIEQPLLNTLLLLMTRDGSINITHMEYIRTKLIGEGDYKGLSSFQWMILDALDPSHFMLQQTWLDFCFVFFSSFKQGRLDLLPIVTTLCTTLKTRIQPILSNTLSDNNDTLNSPDDFKQTGILLDTICSLLDFILSPFESKFEPCINMGFSTPFISDQLERLDQPHTDDIDLSLQEEELVPVLQDVFTCMVQMFIESHQDELLQSFKPMLDTTTCSMMQCLYLRNQNYYYTVLTNVWSNLLSNMDITMQIDQQPQLLWIMQMMSIRDDSDASFVKGILDHYRECFFKSSRYITKKKNETLVSTSTSEISLLLLAEFYTLTLDRQQEHAEFPLLPSKSSLDSIWPLFVAFHRECLSSNIARRRMSLLGLMRWLCVIIKRTLEGSNIDKTSTDNKRLLKEQHDILQKLLDASLLLATKGLDMQSSDYKTLLKSTSDISTIDSGTGGSIYSFQTYSNLKQLDEGIFSKVIIGYLISILPDTISMLVQTWTSVGDTSMIEKTHSMLSGITYYLISPLLKLLLTQSRDGEQNVFELLYSMTMIPSSVRFWKKDYYEFFMDNKFFSVQILGKYRRELTNMILKDDNDRIQEVLHKVNMALSTNLSLFTNKESEGIARSYSVKRVAYMLYCGELDQYLPFLPRIQERIVDLLKHQYVPWIQLYLLVRVIFIKISSHHLGNIWPILIAQVIQSIRTYCDSNSNLDLDAIYALCKWIELIFVMDNEDFQLHEWIFYSDQNSLLVRLYNHIFEEKNDQSSTEQFILRGMTCKKELLSKFFHSIFNRSKRTSTVTGNTLWISWYNDNILEQDFQDNISTDDD